MPQKSVLFLSRLFSPHVGGVETHLENLIKKLPEYHVTIITRQHEPNLPLKEVRDNLRIYRIPFHQSGSLKLATWNWIMSHTQLFRQANVVHIHDVFWWILPIWPLISKKLYITFHGYEGNKPPKYNQIFWHKLAAWLTQGNICIGDFHRKWYGVKPDYVSYGAASIQTKLKNNPSKKKKIVYIGRLHQDTGIMTYLKGLQQYPQLASVNCDVYGDGPLRKQAEQFVQEQHLPVTFHGFVENARQKMAGAEAVFVSRYLAIIEALQVGVPVIAHYDNQIKYDYLALAPFAKWITIVHTPVEVAAALRNPARPPKAAKTWADAQTWEKIADCYKKLWK